MERSVEGQRSTGTGTVLALVGHGADEAGAGSRTIVPLRPAWHPCEPEDLVSGSEDVSLRGIVRGTLFLLSEWLVQVASPLGSDSVTLAAHQPLLHLVHD